MKNRFVIIILLLVSVAVFSQDGKLQKAKEKLKEKPTSSQNPSQVHTVDKDYYKKEKPLKNLFLAIAYNLTYGIAVESVFERNSYMHYAAIAQYPYQSKAIGNFVYISNDSIGSVLSRFDLTNHLLYESSKLYGNDLSMKFRFAKRFDIEAGYLQFFEKTATGTDALSLFSGMVNYHRIRTQKLDFWFGLGTTYITNDVDQWGFTYQLGTEWFVHKPISIFASYSGTQMNLQKINRYKFLIQYYIKSFGVSLGYEPVKIANVKFHNFVLGIGVFL